MQVTKGSGHRERDTLPNAQETIGFVKNIGENAHEANLGTSIEKSRTGRKIVKRPEKGRRHSAEKVIRRGCSCGRAKN